MTYLLLLSQAFTENRSVGSYHLHVRYAPDLDGHKTIPSYQLLVLRRMCALRGQASLFHPLNRVLANYYCATYMYSARPEFLPFTPLRSSLKLRTDLSAARPAVQTLMPDHKVVSLLSSARGLEAGFGNHDETNSILTCPNTKTKKLSNVLVISKYMASAISDLRFLYDCYRRRIVPAPSPSWCYIAKYQYSLPHTRDSFFSSFLNCM